MPKITFFQGVKVLFLLGGQKEGKEDMLLENEIQKEWKHFKDLVREDFVDSYQVNNFRKAVYNALTYSCRISP